MPACRSAPTRPRPASSWSASSRGSSRHPPRSALNRRLLRLGLAIGLVGSVAVVLSKGGGGGDPTPSATSTTAAAEGPSLFGPLPDVDGTPALVTPNGFVVPVLGGEPGAWLVKTPCSNEVEVDGQPIEGAHVVLDPGHGGSETGAIGPNGVREEDVNLDVSLRVKRLLEQRGAVVVLTRSTDVRVTIDMRASLAVALQPRVFVSIHHNAGAVRKQSTPGSETYHHLDDPESKRLAGLIFEELVDKLSPYGTDWVVGGDAGAHGRRSLTDGDDFYGILRRTQGIPGVLSESAYLSNPFEERLLDTEQFRESEATAIASAVIRFVTTDDPGSGYIPALESESDPGGGGGTGGCEDPPLG